MKVLEAMWSICKDTNAIPTLNSNNSLTLQVLNLKPSPGEHRTKAKGGRMHSSPTRSIPCEGGRGLLASGSQDIRGRSRGAPKHLKSCGFPGIKHRKESRGREECFVHKI